MAGPGDTPRAAGRWLVAQAAALHSPNDLRVYLLTDSSGQESWEWARWLPHCRPQAGQDCAMLIGNDAESVATRIAELLAIVSARQQAAEAPGSVKRGSGRTSWWSSTGHASCGRCPVRFSCCRRGLRPGSTPICLDAEEQLLPAECQAVVVMGPGGVRVQQAMAETLPRIRPDEVHPDWCAKLARSIAPVRDVSDADDASVLPESARLLDVLGLEPLAAAAIAAPLA